MTLTAAWAAAEDRRLLGPEAFEAAQLAKGLCCDVVPHPLLEGRFEATYSGGVMIGTAEQLRASRRAQMLGWLWWFTAVGRDVADSGCSEGGACDPELNTECQPPDYHCSKCGRYMGPA